MAEETEQDTGAEAAASSVDPAALALALGGASRDEADVFLKKQGTLIEDQRALIADQRHHLHEQFKKIRLSIWEQWMGLLLRIATGFVGVVLAVGLALIIWDAAHADGLVIEEFSVPPDLASRGITGQVVASQIQDKLTEMQNETASNSPVRSLASDWGDNINVQIPDTGVSVGEAYRFLTRWLGHETHLSGEVYRTPSGIAITGRTGGESGATFTGSEADLDSLVQKVAEHVYGITQPYRYGTYLREDDRAAESVAVFKALAENGSTPHDRAIGYNGWAVSSGSLYDTDVEGRLEERGAALGAGYPTTWYVLGQIETGNGRPEKAAALHKQALSSLSSHGYEFYQAAQIPLIRKYFQAETHDETGDFRDSVPEYADVVQGGLTGFAQAFGEMVLAQLGEHELSTARASISDSKNTGSNPAASIRSDLIATLQIDGAAQNWAGVLSDADAIPPLLQKYPGERSLFLTTVPITAYAEAKLGKTADAAAHIGATPADCYDCLISRARIAEVEGQHARADWWFDRAVKSNRSIPFAYTDWGQSLLERGQPDAAVAQFTLANQKGPHFADPLEGWGEALMEKNRSDLALAKFEEAEKYAPNWGRLHLKWGEALAYAGKKDEAQKQFALAAGLDLSSADKAELAEVRG